MWIGIRTWHQHRPHITMTYVTLLNLEQIKFYLEINFLHM
jgi:hypothetical protein